MSDIYLGTIDGGGDGKTLLLAAINEKINPPPKKPYLMEEFDFGLPEPVQIITPTQNTSIKFGPKLTAGYYGVRTVYYNRIHASELGSIIIPYTGQLLLSDCLTQINEKYGILIQPTDIIDKPITPPTQGDSVKVELEFSSTSIIFYSSAYIQIGQNDPSGDTKPVLPFVNSATFFFENANQFELNGVSQNLLEPFSLAIGTDNERMHSASMTRAMRGDKASSAARVRLTDELYENLKGRLPLVGNWRHPLTGRVQGISVIGDIYELDEEGYTWSFVRNGLGLDPGSPNVALDAYASPNVKAAVQALNGDVYVLARKPGDTPGFWRISATDSTWTKLNFNSVRMQCLDASIWDTVVIKDILHCNSRLWVLLRSNKQYDIHPQKSRTTPSVELYNTTTLSTDYFPLGETKMRFSEIEVDTANGKWALVTPLDTATQVDVVALVPSKVNNNTYVVQYRYQPVGEYLAYLLPHSYISNDPAIRSELDICGYQVPIKSIPAKVNGTDVVGHYLDVVQIIAPVSDAEFNRYFLRTNVRSALTYLSYGVKTMSCISTRTARTPWTETATSLLAATKPSFVSVHGQLGRNHVIFQNGVAMHRTAFRQVAGTVRFDAVIDSQAKLENHTGFTAVNRCGSGVFLPVGLSDTPNTTAELTAIQDDEAALPPIGFSFIARGVDAAPQWYTAQTDTELLTLRRPSPNYTFLGQTPALVLAEGNRTLYMSREGNGFFTSSNRGGSWNEWSAYPAFYKQERPASNMQNILGTAVMPLRSGHFGEAALTSDTLLLDINASDTYNQYDINADSNNAPHLLSDQMLYMIKPGITGNAYVSSSEQAGFGINMMSRYSPRKVLAWDSDRLGNYETVGNYTTDLANPLASQWRITDYMYQTPGVLKDFSRDVKYLGVRHFILTENEGKWYLGFTDAVIPTRTVGLFGSGGEFNNFLPEVNFHLWDYLDEAASYVPYVFYGNKMALLLERLDNDNHFAITQHVLSVPGDNGNPFVAIKMYTANRRDYWFAQKGNGIFKLLYSWDGINRISKVTVGRVFNLNTALLRDLEVTSGCITGIAARQAPMEALIPDALPAGYFIGQHCLGTTLVKRFADGNGGFYEESTPNSVDCGFLKTVEVGPNSAIAQGESE